MKFSIIVPVYNATKYLDECIKSILNQTFSDYELWLIDDGSTDDSGEKCDYYSQIDNRIRVIHKKNGGPSSARRAALERLNGEYVLNIDADDSIESVYLDNISKEIDLTNADMIAWGYTVINEVGEKQKRIFNIQKAGVYYGKELDKVKQGYLYDVENAELNSGNMINATWSKAIKKNIYIYAHDLVPDNIIEGEDAALIWIALKKVKSLCVSNIVGYNYRMTPNSIMNSGKKRLERIESQKVLERCLLENSNTDDELNRAYLFCYYRILLLLECAVENGYTVYKRFTENGMKADIFSVSSYVDISKYSYGSRLRNILIKKHWWLAYYLYSINRSRKTI